MEAYLQFGSADKHPMQTVRVPVKEVPVARNKRGRVHTSSYLVQWEGRWRRVYCCGVFCIGKPGAWVATVTLQP